MTWPVIQKTAQEFASAASSRSLAFGSNVVAGNLLRVVVGGFAGGQPAQTVSVSDSVNGAYTQAGSYSRNGNNFTAIFYFIGTAGGSAPNVTVSLVAFPGTTTFLTIALEEVHPPGSPVTLDSSITNSGTSATPSTGTCPVAGSGESVLAAYSQGTGAGSTTSVSGNFTLENNTNGSVGQQVSTADDTNASASESCTFTTTIGAGSTWAAIAASFKAPASGTKSIRSCPGMI